MCLQERHVAGAERSFTDVLSWLGVRFNEGPNLGGRYGPYVQVCVCVCVCVCVPSGAVMVCVCAPPAVTEAGAVPAVRSSARKGKDY